jgi:hypothetical protein
MAIEDALLKEQKFGRVNIIDETDEFYLVKHAMTENDSPELYNILKSSSTAYTMANSPPQNQSMQLSLEPRIEYLQPDHEILQDKDAPKEFIEVMIFHELREIRYRNDADCSRQQAHELTLHDEILYVARHLGLDMVVPFIAFAKEYRQKRKNMDKDDRDRKKDKKSVGESLHPEHKAANILSRYGGLPDIKDERIENMRDFYNNVLGALFNGKLWNPQFYNNITFQTATIFSASDKIPLPYKENVSRLHALYKDERLLFEDIRNQRDRGGCNDAEIMALYHINAFVAETLDALEKQIDGCNVPIIRIIIDSGKKHLSNLDRLYDPAKRELYLKEGRII